MQVDLITSPGITVPGLRERPVVRASERPSDEAVFRHVEALNRALDEVPAVRHEEVERAKDLFASVQYPPVQLIHRISKLLARDWDKTTG